MGMSLDMPTLVKFIGTKDFLAKSMAKVDWSAKKANAKLRIVR